MAISAPCLGPVRQSPLAKRRRISSRRWPRLRRSPRASAPTPGGRIGLTTRCQPHQCQSGMRSSSGRWAISRSRTIARVPASSLARATSNTRPSTRECAPNAVPAHSSGLGGCGGRGRSECGCRDGGGARPATRHSMTPLPTCLRVRRRARTLATRASQPCRRPPSFMRDASWARAWSRCPRILRSASCP